MPSKDSTHTLPPVDWEQQMLDLQNRAEYAENQLLFGKAELEEAERLLTLDDPDFTVDGLQGMRLLRWVLERMNSVVKP